MLKWVCVEAMLVRLTALCDPSEAVVHGVGTANVKNVVAEAGADTAGAGTAVTHKKRNDIVRLARVRSTSEQVSDVSTLKIDRDQI